MLCFGSVCFAFTSQVLCVVLFVFKIVKKEKNCMKGALCALLKQ